MYILSVLNYICTSIPFGAQQQVSCCKLSTEVLIELQFNLMSMLAFITVRIISKLLAAKRPLDYWGPCE